MKTNTTITAVIGAALLLSLSVRAQQPPETQPKQPTAAEAQMMSMDDMMTTCMNTMAMMQKMQGSGRGAAWA